MDNKYLTQSNFLTRSSLKLKKEIQKDFIYLIQSKIDFFGDVKETININFSDYIKNKGVQRKDTYSFSQFKELAIEMKDVGGAFYNKLNNSFVAFSLFDNIEIDLEDPENFKIDLGKYGKIFFFKKELEKYIKEVTPKGKLIKYTGHTQIENSAINIKGLRRKRFFEVISQFKNTGFVKISLIELKMILGYVEFIDKETKQPIKEHEQMKLIFLPGDQYELKDTCPRFSVFERDFLLPAIKAINEDDSKDINNLKISNKIKTGRKITHLEFKMNAIGKDLTEDEKKALEFFKASGLDENQVVFLLKRIGYKEMYGRYMHNIERKVYNDNGEAKFYVKKSKKEITNMAGYFYKVLFPELNK